MPRYVGPFSSRQPVEPATTATYLPTLPHSLPAPHIGCFVHIFPRSLSIRGVDAYRIKWAFAHNKGFRWHTEL